MFGHAKKQRLSVVKVNYYRYDSGEKPTCIYFSIDDRIQTLALVIYGHCFKSSFMNNNDFFCYFITWQASLCNFNQGICLIISLACPIILCRHADGALNSLKCIYVS